MRKIMMLNPFTGNLRLNMVFLNFLLLLFLIMVYDTIICLVTRNIGDFFDFSCSFTHPSLVINFS
jgi:hypothetical protein